MLIKRCLIKFGFWRLTKPEEFNKNYVLKYICSQQQFLARWRSQLNLSICFSLDAESRIYNVTWFTTSSPRNSKFISTQSYFSFPFRREICLSWYCCRGSWIFLLVLNKIVMKKSRFQKAREEKELKKKKDDEEAAKGASIFIYHNSYYNIKF